MRFMPLRHFAIGLLFVGALAAAPGAFAACSDPAGDEGNVMYNDDYNAVQFCDGTNWIKLGASGSGGGGATVTGNNMEVQFNNNGALGGAANMLWDSGNDRLTVGSATASSVAATVDVTGKTASNSFLFKVVGGAAAPLGGGGAAGSDKQVQYNDNGVMAGSSNLVWDNALKRLSIFGITDYHNGFWLSDNTSSKIWAIGPTTGSNLVFSNFSGGSWKDYFTLMASGTVYIKPTIASANQGMVMDLTNVVAGSNGILISAPSGWTGNFMSGNVNNVQKFRIDQNGLYTQTSDERRKKDIAPIANALDRLAQINGVTFHWKDEGQGTDEQMGVIAQDVQKVFPQLVSEDDGYLGVNYAGLVAPLIEAVKTLRQENEELRKRIDALEAGQ